MAKPGTKDRLLIASSHLFARQGYSGTGLKQVTAQARAPWGSMYHFFPGGKEQLAVEAIVDAASADDARLRLAFEKAPDVRAAVKQIFRAEQRRIEESDFTEGCPVGTVAMDVAAAAAKVREACAAAFAMWERTIAAALVDAGLSESDAKTFAAFTLSTLEGAIMLSRTMRSNAPMRQSAAMVDVILEALLRSNKV